MKKTIPILVVAVAIAGVAVTLMIQRRAKAKLRENEAVLQQQGKQLSELAVEQQRLSNLVAQANGSPAEDLTAELARLRSKAEALRKQTNELGKQLEQNRRSRSALTAAKPESHPPEYYEQLHKMAGAKPMDARNLSSVFLMYASDHKGQFPSSLDQLSPYLRKQDLSLTGTNEFEIVYRGSLDELKKLPLGSVAVVRDRQAWLAPSGKMVKVYGMANGTGQIVESDDNFKSWEAEHILPSPTVGR